MDVTPLIPQGRQIIQSYGDTGFKINGRLHEGAVIVFPEETWDWLAPNEFSSLTISHFEVLFSKASDLDVVLLGCGSRQQFFPPLLRAALKEKGLIVDVMDSGAACRTYNVLMGEGRRVVAALLPTKNLKEKS